MTNTNASARYFGYRDAEAGEVAKRSNHNLGCAWNAVMAIDENSETFVEPADAIEAALELIDCLCCCDQEGWSWT